jgi:hypothetical protein
MPTSAAELERQRLEYELARWREHRLNPARRTRSGQNEVEYKSDAEFRQVEADLERRLYAATTAAAGSTSGVRRRVRVVSVRDL